ncbi:carbohydrate ABC transporter permease [Schaalia hyovaginalis]|uniref:carbohydrate ABC transporter permease n=1 Tax=Schaalia hyovaginalis TaxID=29316 RepID=UPI0038B3A22A
MSGMPRSIGPGAQAPSLGDGALQRWNRRRRQERARNAGGRRIRGHRLVIRYLTLIIVAILLVGPLVLPLMAAFKAPGEAVFGQGATLLPQQWSLASFQRLFERTDILGAIGNSAIIASLTVVSNIVLSCAGGYMLSRRGWTGRRIMYVLVLSAMIFPFESIMLSLYKMMVQIDLYNTLPGVWMVAMIGPFQILMMRAAFMGVPDEIEDAALIDGAGELRRFWSIFLPQVRGTLTVVGLTSFIAAWSDFLFPLLMLPDPKKQTLMLALTAIQNSPQGTTYQLVLAGAVVALLPVIILFSVSQRFFFRGIEAGGLKF